MSMNARINTYALQHNPIESASIGVLGSVAVTLQDEGDYFGTVYRNGREMATFHIVTVKNAAETQADIDFATLVPDGGERREPCDHNADTTVSGEHVYTVITGGYMVFYVSQGAGNFQVDVDYVPHDGGERMSYYKNGELRPGCFFIVTLLRPGHYQMRDMVYGGSGDIAVAYPPKPEGEYTAPEPVQVSVMPGEFDTPSLQLQPTQSIVFDVRSDRASLVVELLEPDDGPGDLAVRWTNPLDSVE